MNTAEGVGLFFLGSFALLYTTVSIPSVEFYTGGIVIALFIFSLFYAYANAIRQAHKVPGPSSEPPQESNHEKNPLEAQA